jgi:hypothetical protein
MNLENYRQLIQKTAYNYSFKKINHELNPKKIKSNKESICFLRHDIDFSPKNALEIARLEAKENVVSTFTVLLTSQYYSPFNKNTRDLLKKIKNYGHEIGLHFDPSFYNIKAEKDLDFYVAKEADILRDLLDVDVRMFSFHQTNNFSMSCRSMTYGNLINAYSNFFHNDVEYTSDSNGYWRFRSWEELLLEKHKIIQVLTHPIWWLPNNSLPPLETIIKCCLERFEKDITDYNKIFDKQNFRVNKSALTEYLIKEKKNNNSKILNEYVKYPLLIKFLLNKNKSKEIIELKEIVTKFLAL